MVKSSSLRLSQYMKSLNKIYLLLVLIPFLGSGQNITFDAEGLLFLNDADMSAFCLDDGKVRKQQDNKDLLSGLVFPLNYGSSNQINSVSISNSVLGSQKAISISSDQKKAYILESRGPVKSTFTQVENALTDFPIGKYITVADISNPNAVKAKYRFPAGENTSSLTLDPSNQNLLICSEEYNKELQIFELDNEGKPVRIIKKPQNLKPGRITHADWDPSGNFIVYLNVDAGEVGILQVLKDGPTGQIIRMEPYGEPITIEGRPSYGTFTPDSRYYIILDPKTEITKSDIKGQLFVLKLNLVSETANSFLLSKVEVPANSNSFDIHPDGSYIAVSSIERSFEVPSDLSNNEGSVSIYSLGVDGSIAFTEKNSVEGVFPTSLAFDKTGENLAVSVFQYLTFGYTFGGIEFFKFDTGADTLLKKQKGKVYLQPGVHSLKPVFSY